MRIKVILGIAKTLLLHVERNLLKVLNWSILFLTIVELFSIEILILMLIIRINKRLRTPCHHFFTLIFIEKISVFLRIVSLESLILFLIIETSIVMLKVLLTLKFISVIVIKTLLSSPISSISRAIHLSSLRKELIKLICIVFKILRKLFSFIDC